MAGRQTAIIQVDPEASLTAGFILHHDQRNTAGGVARRICLLQEFDSRRLEAAAHDNLAALRAFAGGVHKEAVWGLVVIAVRDGHVLAP